MAGFTIHTDAAHISTLLPQPVSPADQDTIQRKLRQFLKEQNFQQVVDREIRRIYEAEIRPPADDPDHAVIWTDGSCQGNPGPGGWAYVVTSPDGRTLAEQSGHAPQTTNNRMELTAIAEALEAAAGRHRRLTIWSDSQYAVNAFNLGWIRKWETNGWRTAKRQPVKNPDLWRRIRQLLADSAAAVEFRWIKGHAGHPGNERADHLANLAAQRA